MTANNHILCRKNVFCCNKSKTDYNPEKQKFEHVCEVTGEKWQTGVWSPYRDYEKDPDPVITPCKTCEHVKCEWCAFNSKDKEPYGCCGSCAYKETCVESRWKAVRDIKEFDFLE